MKHLIVVATWLVRSVVWLYPRPFRDDFGDEMRGVIEYRLQDAIADGRALAVCAHELRGTLSGLVREHVHAVRTGQVDARALLLALLIGCWGPLLLLRDRTMMFFCDFANLEGGGIINRAACTLQNNWGIAPNVVAIVTLLPLVAISIFDGAHSHYLHMRRWLRLLAYVVIAALVGLCQQLITPWMYAFIPLPGLGVILFFGLWLLPAFALAIDDMRRERTAAVATPTAILGWLVQIQGYTVGYAAILASGADNPLMHAVGLLGATLAELPNAPMYFFQPSIRIGIPSLMWQRAGVALVCGLVIGNIARLYGVWRYRAGQTTTAR